LSIGLTIEDIEGWDEALDAVTIDDVRKAAEKVLDRRNAVTGYLVRPETLSADAGADETASPDPVEEAKE
jgi:zinc protease